MQIDLECKCTATHKWVLIARFEYVIFANTAARALGRLDGCTYRVIDRRWMNEGAYVFEAGELAA